jgi:hypothetical protein
MHPEDLLSTPEYYADSVQFMTNIYGFTLEFGTIQPEQEGAPRPRVRIKMSPQHAKIMALQLLRNVQEYETRVGKVNMPDELYQSLGIDPNQFR